MMNWRITFLLCVLVLLFNSSLEQAIPLRLMSERLALVQLRSSLGLRRTEWPIKADPCSSWLGIQCRNGQVVGINISGFRRTVIGDQNPQFAIDPLANFSSLSYFNASYFKLPGHIPDWFGLRLGALQVLDLMSCSVTGTIPPSFGNLINLTTLVLSNNNLTGTIPPSMGNLSSLSVLNLSRNSLTGSIPLSFSSLLNLTFLDMSSNFLSGAIPPAIGTLSKMQFLNLSSNSLSSTIPAQFGDLNNLIDLDLSFNSLSGSLPVDLFPALNKLQFVRLGQNEFAGYFPVTVWSMPELILLDVSNNNFSDTLPNSTFNTNQSAAVLNLSNNKFYGRLTNVLERFILIDLSGNYFQGIIPNYIPGNATLDRNCLGGLSNQKSTADCSSFYGHIFADPTSHEKPMSEQKRRRLIIILAAVLSGVGFIAVLLVMLLFLCNRKKKPQTRREIKIQPAPTSGLGLNFSHLGEKFTHEKILLATDNFNDANLIKHGHSGDLFRGLLESGTFVVIKRVDLSAVKSEGYMLELEFFSRVSHTRFVSLLGYCLEKDNEKFLVYKHIPNGDLPTCMYRRLKNGDDDLQSMDWITRLKVAIGAAEGLSYMHHECSPPMVHRDFQSSSVLLDNKFEVRLGSLSEVCIEEEGAHQKPNTIRELPLSQMSTDQSNSGPSTATCATDVYCFGKVLLELITGKIGIDTVSSDWLEVISPYISMHDKELIINIVDPSLIINEDLLEEIWSMAIVAKSCLNPIPTKRPLMRYVLKALENPLKVVRVETKNPSSRKRGTMSSISSWNSAFFGSGNYSSSFDSRGNKQNVAPTRRRYSNEIFPEPLDV